jgi:hypothetical protein
METEYAAIEGSPRQRVLKQLYREKRLGVFVGAPRQDVRHGVVAPLSR